MARRRAARRCRSRRRGCHPRPQGHRRAPPARVGRVGHAPVRAEDVHARLPVLWPCISKARHRVYTRQAHGGGLVGPKGRPARWSPVGRRRRCCCRSARRSGGAAHPDTLTTRSNLASCTGEAGDPARAPGPVRGAVPVREKVFGADRHRDTRKARASLAYWTRQADTVAQ